MKHILLLAFSMFMLQNLIAQTCTPIPSYKDSTIGIYPRPYDAVTSPKGGITKVACIGKNYSFDLQVIIPDTFLFAGLAIQMSSATIKAVKGLPKGLSYACNVPNCKFLAKKPGCINVYGLVDPVVIPGQFDLTIDVELATGLGNIPQSFPNPAIAPGVYSIKVVKNTDILCQSATSDLSDLGVNMLISPNPTQDFANLTIDSELFGNYNIQVIDMVGRVVNTQNVALSVGTNFATLKSENLNNGIYTVRLQNEKGQLTRKLVIQK